MNYSRISLPVRHSTRAHWAPVYYYPIAGSNDRFTVAVAAISTKGSEAVVVEAPGLNRLRCLFGQEAEVSLNIIDVFLSSLRSELDRRGIEALVSETSSLSSFEIGQPDIGSGMSVSDIAASWVHQLSALHLDSNTALEENTSPKPIREGRLITSVKSSAIQKFPFLRDRFNYSFRPEGNHLPVKIGFRGSHIVANFERFIPKNISYSVDHVRSKLWSLAIHRDQAPEASHLDHEMLLLCKPGNDNFSKGSFRDVIDRASDDLEREADRYEIRLRSLSSVDEIANTLVRAEMRAAE